MTAKRFTIKNERTIKDNQKYVTENGYVFSWKSDAEEVCNLLNKLYEENQELKQQLEKNKKIKENPTVKDNIKRLTQIFQEENNSLKQDIYNMRKAFFEDVKEFERLLKENEELKEEIKTLKYRLSSYEIE